METIENPRQYVTDPGEPYGFNATDAADLWREFRRLPEDQQLIEADTPLYRLALAYAGAGEEAAKEFAGWTPQMRGRYFALHVIPSVILRTPTPAWAGDTLAGFQEVREPTCLHSADLAATKQVCIGANQEDTYNVETGVLTKGNVVGMFSFDTWDDTVTPAQLREIAAACILGAERLEALQAGNA